MPKAFILALLASSATASVAWAGVPAVQVGGVNDSFGTICTASCGWTEDRQSVNSPGATTTALAGVGQATTTTFVSLGGGSDPSLQGHPGETIQAQMRWESQGALDWGAETDARAYLTYYFTVSGPDGYAPILYDTSASLSTGPLSLNETIGADFGLEVVQNGLGAQSDVIAYYGEASGDGNNSFENPLSSNLLVSANPDGPISPSAPAVACDTLQGCYQSIHLAGVAELKTNVVYQVELHTSTHLEVGGPPTDGSSMVNTMIDPIFMVDPNAPNASDYTLTFSDGIIGSTGFPTGVPEPATWAILLIGLLGIGAALRGRRTSTAGHLAA